MGGVGVGVRGRVRWARGEENREVMRTPPRSHSRFLSFASMSFRFPSLPASPCLQRLCVSVVFRVHIHSLSRTHPTLKTTGAFLSPAAARPAPRQSPHSLRSRSLAHKNRAQNMSADPSPAARGRKQQQTVSLAGAERGVEGGGGRCARSQMRRFFLGEAKPPHFRPAPIRRFHALHSSSPSPQYDRYIPNRDAMDFEAGGDALLAEDGAAGRPGSAGDARILAFRSKVRE